MDGSMDSRYTWSRGWTYLTLKVGEALGPLEDRCPHVGGFWSDEAGVCEWVKETGKWEGRKGDATGSCRGETRKGHNI